MRYIDLFEGRDAPLYHTMDYDKAMDVFENDFMPARWTHKIPGIGAVVGNSFSRNKNLRFRNHVLLTVNQRAITKNKIIPLDGNAIFSYTTSGRSFDRNDFDRNRHDPRKGYKGIGWGDTKSSDGKIIRGQTLSEEFVVGDIKQLHTIITKIYLFMSPNYMLYERQCFKLFEITKAYSEKYNITLSLSNDFQSIVDEYKEKLEKYDDE